MKGKKKRFSLGTMRRKRRPPAPLVGFRPSDLHAKCVLGSDEEWEIYKACMVLCHYIVKKYTGERKKEAQELIMDLKEWIERYPSRFQNTSPEERKRRSIKYLDEEVLIHACCILDIKYDCGMAMEYGQEYWEQIKKDIRAWVEYDF